MNKLVRILVSIGIIATLTACKSVSPEAQAVIDAIKASSQNEEHTAQEYLDIQDQYNALDEEKQKEVSSYAEYQTKMDEYFAGKKKELADAMAGKKYYYSEKEASVAAMSFSEDKVNIALYEYDGNGKHEQANVDYDYLCDGSKMTIMASVPTDVEYKIENGSAVLGSGYYTEDMILDALQGDWTYWHKYDWGSATEYNMTISGSNAKYENAAEALGYDDGAYYYYGPYEGSITITDGSVSIDATHGEEFFFACYNGEVQLYHYGNKMTRGHGLKGEEGYYDSF